MDDQYGCACQWDRNVTKRRIRGEENDESLSTANYFNKRRDGRILQSYGIRGMEAL